MTTKSHMCAVCRSPAAQAIGIAALSDMGDVPYYLCAVLCGLYQVLAQPLESSFHQQLKAARAIGGGSAATPSEAIVQVRVRSSPLPALTTSCSTRPVTRLAELAVLAAHAWPAVIAWALQMWKQAMQECGWHARAL